MNYSKKKKQERTPLFVKEIIFPDKNKFEIGMSSGTASNILKNEIEKRSENTVTKIGNHEVRLIGQLQILEKKPLENYFEGTVEKKQIKKKIRHQRATQNLRKLQCKELQTASNVKESVEKDEKTERTELQLKIEKFEKMREHRNQNNYLRQRLAEEKYIQQQENLAETWWELMKRRNQLKQSNLNDILTDQKLSCKGTYKNYNRFCISITSQKFWYEDQVVSAVESSEKSKEDDGEQEERGSEPISEWSMSDDLEDRFLEKLVFVDDEDSNDLDYRRGNF